jgi:hypothetical protein
MSGTPSQNPLKTMGSKSLWEPMAEPGTEESPTTTIESQRKNKVEKRKVKNIPTQDAGWRTGKSETMLRRSTHSQLSGGRYPRLWKRVLQH